jgi:hypothetical protein
LGRSRKPSASKPAPPEVVFFLDEGLGRYEVAQALRLAGYQVVPHHELFLEPGTPDEQWLPKVGELGFVVLSKDDAIRLNHGQKEILLAANVRAFFLGRADASGSAMAAAFLSAAPRMIRIVRTEGRAFIARVHPDGRVTFIERAPRRMRAHG